MALDGAILSLIVRDINERAADSHIEKISMPSKDMVVIGLSKRGFSGRLVLSCNPVSPRAHLTDEKFENPATPPMLCMLLRKRLNGRLKQVRQAGMDRILFFDFDCKNELGDDCLLTLAMEIMGRGSNIIFMDEDQKIIETLRRMDPKEGKRFLLPGATYELPPQQDRFDIFEDSEKLISEIENSALPLDKAIGQTVSGLSPIVCREASLKGNPADAIEFIKSNLEQGGTPTLVCDLSGEPKDFTFVPISQYGDAMQTFTCSDYHTLLCRFYSEREQRENLRRHSQDLIKLITNLKERTARKIIARQMEKKKCEDREILRRNGELIKANLHAIENGQPTLTAINYYDPDCATVDIPLDVTLSPSQNAQKYFKEYRKASTAAQMLDELIEKAQADALYFDAVGDSIARAQTTGELLQIREELRTEGFIKGSAPKGRQTALPPLKFISSDGYEILVGRTNLQNDKLTLQIAEKSDIWLHTKDIPGSHVVIRTGGKIPPDNTITEAAILAATHSKGANSSMVPVEYTFAKFVKKPKGAKPGMVIYTNNKTAYVNPDIALCEKLKD